MKDVLDLLNTVGETRHERFANPFDVTHELIPAIAAADIGELVLVEDDSGLILK
jgi:hypothetical protein